MYNTVASNVMIVVY